MMAAQPTGDTGTAARHPALRFANCQICGKLTLQAAHRPCLERGQCHAMVVELRDIAETEPGAFARKPPDNGG